MFNLPCQLNHLEDGPLGGVVLIRLAQVGRPALCGWRHSLKWNPRLLKGECALNTAFIIFCFLTVEAIRQAPEAVTSPQ